MKQRNVPLASAIGNTNYFLVPRATSNKTAVLSDSCEEVQSAGDESTITISEYKFGKTWRPDVASQASATGGKQRSRQNPTFHQSENGMTKQLYTEVRKYL